MEKVTAHVGFYIPQSGLAQAKGRVYDDVDAKLLCAEAINGLVTPELLSKNLCSLFHIGNTRVESSFSNGRDVQISIDNSMQSCNFGR